ncbi:hypothetical protein JQC67_17320 [Aurantibacter crassamenti]|uniref:DUF6252 family protein n=1 Tax=Aurantibacter crassamenti TaxID=1837375 RepID=UPI00193A09E7|nr:DUF6252 family protein [Aurantibacter crassamenti]MBM1107919.1 hypothetical protein [Aurantibacter crassamenti]
MRQKHLKSIALIFLFSISFLVINNCGKSTIENALEDIADADEDNEGESNEDTEEQIIPSFTAQINDSEFEATLLISQSLTGARISNHSFGYALAITGQYVAQDLKSSKLIWLFAYGTDFNELKAGSEFNNVTSIILPQSPGAYAIYGEDPNSDIEDDNYGTSTVEEISIKITGIDREKMLISGEFNFIAVNDDTSQKYKITEGVFTDLTYEIQ